MSKSFLRGPGGNQWRPNTLSWSSLLCRNFGLRYLKAYNVRKASVSRSKSDNQAAAFNLEATTRCPPRCPPAAQSHEFVRNALKLSKFGSLEPDNSDTFVSSPHVDAFLTSAGLTDVKKERCWPSATQSGRFLKAYVAIPVMMLARTVRDHFLSSTEPFTYKKTQNEQNRKTITRANHMTLERS